MGSASISERSPVTVERALTLTELQRGDPVVRAGRRQLDRAIRWVHAAEVPNIARLLRGNELLLTTGIGLGKRALDQRRFIRGLAEREIAGLVIELGQAFDDIPGAFVEEAESWEMPLIALRREVPFVEVTEAIHREILERQNRYLERGTEVHDEFTQIILGGGDVAEVMRALSQTLRNPVLLENEQRELLCHAEFRAPETEVLAVWRTIGGEPAGPGPGEPLVLPLPMGGADGRLVVLPLDGPIGDLDRVIVERAAWLLALVMLRTDQERQLSLHTRGDFLFDLARGRLTPEEAAAEARSLDFSPSGYMLPVVIRAGHRQPSPRPGRAIDIGSDLRNELAQRKLSAVVGLKSATEEVLLVVAAPNAGERPRIANQIAGAVREIVARRLSGGAPIIAIGGAADWVELSAAMRETIEAAKAAESMEERPWHDAMEADMERLIWQLRDNEALHSFVQRQLGPLLEHDRGRKGKLMPTLEALCRQGGNKAETARELFLARQALYNRLRRISEILGFDVTEPENFQAANLAVIAARHIGDDQAGSRAAATAS